MNIVVRINNPEDAKFGKNQSIKFRSGERTEIHTYI